MKPNMDDFYEEIFGERPSKKGKGYELIVASTLKALNKLANVSHDVFIKSSHSNETFQADAYAEFFDSKIFIESKDHQERNAKVGRPEVSKLAGSLLVLNDVDIGLIASSTDFTSDAKNYVEDLNKAKQKPIDLFIIRQSNPLDEEGRIKTIVANINVVFPDIKNAKFEPIIEIEEDKYFTLTGKKFGEQVDLILDAFYDKNGNVIETVGNLISKLKVDYDKMVAEGNWDFELETHIKINSNLVPIKTFKYQIPYLAEVSELKVAGGKPIIYVRAIDGSINKLVSEEDLLNAHNEIVSQKGI